MGVGPSMAVRAGCVGPHGARVHPVVLMAWGLGAFPTKQHGGCEDLELGHCLLASKKPREEEGTGEGGASAEGARGGCETFSARRVSTPAGSWPADGPAGGHGCHPPCRWGN